MKKRSNYRKEINFIIVSILIIIFSSFAYADLYLNSKTGYINLNTTGQTRLQITPGGNLNLLGLVNVSIPGNLSIGGNVSVDENTFFVDSESNKVGIGTSSPLTTLHVNGSGAAGGFRVTNESGQNVFLVNSSSGFVGIGTDSPDTLLHIRADNESSNSAITLNVPKDSVDSSALIIRKFGGNASGSSDSGVLPLAGNILYTAGGTSADLIFNPSTGGSYLFEVGLTAAAVIDSSGSVGIGAVSPNYLLQTGFGTDGRSVNLSNVLFVNASNNSIMLSGNLGSSSPYPRPYMKFRSDSTTTNGFYVGLNDDRVARVWHEQGLPLAFGTNNAERMRIDENGNIGIGTTGPGRHLDIAGNPGAGASEGIRINHTGNTDGGSWFLAELCPAAGCISSGAFVIQQDGGTSSGVKFIVLNNSGSVGIGTVTPSHKLDVKSNTVRFDGSGGGEMDFYLTTTDTGQSRINLGGTTDPDAGQIIYSDNSDAFLLYTNNSERIRIDSSGSIGINTTGPAEKLHINEGNLRFESEYSSISGNGITYSYHSNNVPSAMILFNSTSSHTSNEPGEIQFWTRKTDAEGAGTVAQNMVVKSSGNVGIGTASPDGLLHLEASSGGASLDINGSDWARVRLTDTSDAWTVGFIANQNKFQLYDWTNGTALATVDLSGNVGIGTDSPDRLLTVQSAADAIISVKSSNTGTSYLLLGDTDGDTVGQISYDHTNNFMALQTSATEKVRIDSSGNVGIGTTAPTELLVVSGNANITGTLYKGTSAYTNPDIAETMKPYGGINFESGSVVCVSEKDPEGFNNYVEICKGKYNSSVVGIVSVNATMIIGSKGEMPIALMGRVFVKVTNESGPISKGDLLTTSSTPGKAMKFELLEAEKGMSNDDLVDLINKNEKRRNSILGKSLESFDGRNGKIIALVALQ